MEGGGGVEVTRSPTPSPSFVAALWGAHSSGSPRKVWRNDDMFVVAISPEALGEPPCLHGKREEKLSVIASAVHSVVELASY